LQGIAREIAYSGRGEVFGTHVDAVRTSGKRDVRTIVDVDRDPERGTQRLGEFEHPGCWCSLGPDLDGGDASSFGSDTGIHEIREFQHRWPGDGEQSKIRVSHVGLPRHSGEMVFFNIAHSSIHQTGEGS
jgi:hypothetical protein